MDSIPPNTLVAPRSLLELLPMRSVCPMALQPCSASRDPLRSVPLRRALPSHNTPGMLGWESPPHC